MGSIWTIYSILDESARHWKKTINLDHEPENQTKNVRKYIIY